MICQNCNTDNQDGAVYCKNCGSRIDGNTQCPHCGSAIAADSVYCNFCGKRVDGKINCPDCGALLPADSAFCEVCGKQLPSVQPVKVKNTVNTAELQNVIGYLTTAFAILAAFFSFVFVFCTGVSFSGSLEIDGIIPEAADHNIYYYMSSAAYEAFSAVTEHDAISATALIISIFGTLISVATLVSVLVTSIMTMTYGTIKLIKKDSKRDPFKLAIITVMCFITGAVLLAALENVSAVYGGSQLGSFDIDMNYSVGLNGATVAGIVLSLIFMFSMIFVKAAANYKQLFKLENIIKAASCAVSIVLVIIVALMGQSQGYGVYVRESGGSMKTSLGFLNATTSCAAYTYFQDDLDALLNMFCAINVIAQVLVAAFVITCIFPVISNSQYLGGKEGKGYISSIVMVVLSTLLLAVSIWGKVQFGNIYKEIGASSSLPGISIGIPIATFVLSLINLAVIIVGRVVKIKGDTAQDENAQNENAQV